MSPDSFTIFAEFGVALAGFSGIALALSQRGEPLSGLLRLRTLSLLGYALIPAFASMLPLVFSGFAFSEASTWRYTSLSLAGLLVFQGCIPIRLRAALSPGERAAVSKVLWHLGTTCVFIVAAMLVSNAVLLASPGPILFALVYVLAFAAVTFARLLVGAAPPAA